MKYNSVVQQKFNILDLTVLVQFDVAASNVADVDKQRFNVLLAQDIMHLHWFVERLQYHGI